MYIAIGQVWRTRGGLTARVTGLDLDDPVFPWEIDKLDWVTKEGKKWPNSTSPSDLVELIQDVAPPVTMSEPIARAGAFLQAQCHGASVEAGWWNHSATGLDLRKVICNPEGPLQELLAGALVSQKLCLSHSEISEAMEGHRKGLMDDKLPHRPMIEVELADVVIRVADLAGALGLDLGGAIAEKMAFNRTRADHQPEARAAAGGKAY